VADVGFVLFLVAFFALAAGFVVACDKIIGESAAFEDAEPEAEEHVAA